MAKGFKQEDVSNLLAQVHRRCCICHRFCGTKIETDHIVPKEQNGSDDIDNAIAVCFECHAEIHSYNDKHPRGRKFRENELRIHKEKWIKICENHPEILTTPGWESDVGPLQALIDELEFNIKVATYHNTYEIGCMFHERQFLKAINEGAISILIENLKDQILDAYAAIGVANQLISSAINQPLGNSRSSSLNLAQKKILEAKPKIISARAELLKFLTIENYISK